MATLKALLREIWCGVMHRAVRYPAGHSVYAYWVCPVCKRSWPEL